MKAKFEEAEIQDNGRVVATVVYVNVLPDGANERIKINVFIYDTALTIAEIPAAAIEQANNLLKHAASLN